MNDAERDAWLREALRHAPDSDVLPPSGVSEAILLKARAAARGGASAGRGRASRAAPSSAFAAVWAWLARPPVAAGFASVMAATLVGLMWWDRPMDETMPPPPAVASDRAAPPPAATTPAPAAVAPAAPVERDKSATTAPTDSTPAAPIGDDRARRSAGASDRIAMKSAPTGAAKVDESAPVQSKGKLEALAKERALPAERKNEAPAPFPSTEAQREVPAKRQALDATTSDAAKKAVEPRRTAGADAAGADAAERAAAPPAAPALAQTAPATAAAPMAQPRDVTAAPSAERVQRQRQRAFGDVRDKDAAASASAPAPFRSELERPRPEAVARADAPTRAPPLARVLPAIAAAPEQWARQTAGGDSVALDPGWRAWLAELDAAAAGRWRLLGGVGEVGGSGTSTDADARRDGGTTLRLVNGGRVAALVRIEGTTVRVDASPGTGLDRWQSSVSPASAERLRDAARRLPP